MAVVQPLIRRPRSINCPDQVRTASTTCRRRCLASTLSRAGVSACSGDVTTGSFLDGSVHDLCGHSARQAHSALSSQFHDRPDDQEGQRSRGRLGASEVAGGSGIRR